MVHCCSICSSALFFMHLILIAFLNFSFLYAPKIDCFLICAYTLFIPSYSVDGYIPVLLSSPWLQIILIDLIEMIILIIILLLTVLIYLYRTLTKLKDPRASDIDNPSKIQSLFPSHIIGCLKNLESIVLEDCQLLEVIFQLEELNFEESVRTPFPLPCLCVCVCFSKKKKKKMRKVK